MRADRELWQVVQPLLPSSDRSGGLLGRGLAVQVVVGQGLHGADPVPYQSHHLLLGDGQVQVDSLQEGTERERVAVRFGFTSLLPNTDFSLQKSKCFYL